MISFDDYLAEEVKLERLGDEDDPGHIYTHRAWVGPHVVDVMIPHEGGGHYSVMAKVNHSMNRDTARVTDPDHARRIAMTVRGAVDSFIRQRHPSSVSFSPSSGLSRDREQNEWKGEHYKRFARSLAGKHHGRYVDDDDVQAIRFD